MEFIINYFKEVWWLTQEMAPWLILGFAIAGICSHFIPGNFIEKHLAKRNWSSIFKSVVIGIPLPLCSCGVIPVAASLRQKGASKGATAAFTAATPQTGVDSIAATYSLMGWIFTLGRLAANLISGILAGILINLFSSDSDKTQATKAKSSCCHDSEDKSASPKASCCHAQEEEKTEDNPKSCCSSSSEKKPNSWSKAFFEGFVKMPADIGKYLVLGILLGALISVSIPEDTMSQYLDHPLLTYVAVTVIAIPLYVCATGSIPLAFALLQAGISPGAAIVFLVAGPATNTATVFTLFKLIGKRETFIYLITLIIGAWVVGYFFDYWIPEQTLNIASPQHEMDSSSLLATLSAIALIAILIHAFIRNPMKR